MTDFKDISAMGRDSMHDGRHSAVLEIIKKHDKRLEQVLEKIGESETTVNRSNCQFRVRKVKLLGHKVSGEGITLDPEKQRAINGMKPLSIEKSLRASLKGKFQSKFNQCLVGLDISLRELIKRTSRWL